MSRFIDGHRARFGVEPICRVLSANGVPFASRTYRAHRARPASARALMDLVLVRQIADVHSASNARYGARKVHAQLRRDGVVVARCTVERLMRSSGLAGVRRDKSVRTTIPAKGAPRPADLVDRNFTAAAPNRLWVVDFT